MKLFGYILVALLASATYAEAGPLIIPAAMALGGGLLATGMGFAASIGMSAGWLIGSWLFGPNKENQIFDPGAQEMPRFNQSLRGVTMPVLFGTNRVASNVVWTKNFQTIRQEQSQKAGGGSGGGGGEVITVAYTYKWDMLFHFGMVVTPMALVSGWADTKRISSDSIDAINASTGIIDGEQGEYTPEEEGGEGVPIGGDNGNVDTPPSVDVADLEFEDSFFSVGDPTGVISSRWEYFEDQQGYPCRWPSTTYIGFRGFDLGNYARIPQLSFEIGPAGDVDADVYPPYVIYHVLTNQYFGIGIDPDLIDTDTYADALTYCSDEGIKISVQYLREEGVLGLIDNLLALYGGYLIVSGGRVKFGVQQDTTNAARTIDNHHLVVEEGEPPVVITKPALQDGYNRVRVNYFDRSLDYRQNQVERSDEVDIDFNGPRMREFPPKFVMNYATAAKIAERALWTNLYGRETYNFTLGWKDADLEPGDVVTLVDSFHTELAGGKNVRIVKWREEARGKFNVTAVIEIPYLLSGIHSIGIFSEPSEGKLSSSDLLPMAAFRMYELPQEFQGANANLHIGYNALSPIRGAVFYLSNDGVNFTAAGAEEPYCLSGMFAQALPNNDNMMRAVKVYLFPGSGFSAATPTYAMSSALDDVSAIQRSNGLGCIFAGSEMLAMEGLTLLAQNYYQIDRLYRGWGGTAVQAHTSGNYWHKHGLGIFEEEITTDQIGNVIWYKAVPYNFAGQVYNVASVTANTYSIRGTYWLPQHTRTLRFFVTSPTTWNPASPTRANTAVAVVSGGCDVLLSWADTARMSGYGTGGYGTGGYGRWTADLDAHSWLLEIRSPGGFTVRSVVLVGTTGYVYTRATNSADFTGWADRINYVLTAFNQYGDALRTETKRTNLFFGAVAEPTYLTTNSGDRLTTNSLDPLVMG